MATDKNITIHTSKGDIKLTVFASKTVSYTHLTLPTICSV